MPKVTDMMNESMKRIYKAAGIRPETSWDSDLVSKATSYLKTPSAFAVPATIPATTNSEVEVKHRPAIQRWMVCTP